MGAPVGVRMVPIEFLSGGTGFPLVASAAACIGSSQPMQYINVDLTGVVYEYAAPNVTSCLASSMAESSKGQIIVHEVLTPA
jgi:hypothetical protein